MPFDKAKAFAQLIEITQDPLMPIRVEGTHEQVHQLGKALATCTSLAQVEALQARLMADFESLELDELSKTPAFIMALCAMLEISLVDWAKELGTV